MTPNPLLNALAAILYILSVTLTMWFGSQFAPKEDTILAPMAFISVFTLSAAVMAYIFCYQPLQLFLSNKKDQAVKLFLYTTAIFALFTIILLTLAFSGIFI